MPGLSLIEIRPYRANDLDGVIDLFQRAVRETASADYSAVQIDVWSHVDRDEWELARLSRPTWVAFVGGELAGFADLEKNGLVDMMFVDPKHQRTGVATALLARVEAEADEADIGCLHTYASVTARPFFEYCGFTMLLARAVVVREQRFVQFVMEKVL
ncbi:GNAT family N-acetyltransferase [Caballeronia insecticola]|uniref:GCN5-related N-acetyltransferase n=1 Tax=Caballeronia insecticola TaxID=758793 RepID=R4WKT3_9BURK|nr:GNAT family N-acetyltransferase [Caballeronia insecticola]BAN25064.1 GCN5-related N-acetyltransferase [Caballeronia insecticola]